jgi:peptidyl-prolyl cis-trans isomerase A (cyclophilin A)
LEGTWLRPLAVTLGVIIILCAFFLPAGSAEQAQNQVVRIETGFGDIYIELFLDICPITAGNFLNLTENGFYDGLTFHRIDEYFVIKGGDPRGDGTGGAGWSIPDEASAFSLNHTRGSVAMANTGEPNSSSSQFYICLTTENVQHLNGENAIFGKVVEGMDVVDEISHVEVKGNYKPVEDVVMTQVSVADYYPPVAKAGKDQEAFVDEKVVLDASGSTDEVGIAVYTWSFMHEGENITLEGKVKEFRFKEEGTFEVTLTVEDTGGNTATDTLTVEVREKELADVLYEWSCLVGLLVVLVILVAAAYRTRGRPVETPEEVASKDVTHDDIASEVEQAVLKDLKGDED